MKEEIDAVLVGRANGDSMDVTYDDDRKARTEREVIDHVMMTLSLDSGVLRCRHGDRLLVLYARSVATVEVAPRGAVLQWSEPPWRTGLPPTSLKRATVPPPRRSL